jgi:hypothetical protein
MWLVSSTMCRRAIRSSSRRPSSVNGPGSNVPPQYRDDIHAGPTSRRPASCHSSTSSGLRMGSAFSMSSTSPIAGSCPSSHVASTSSSSPVVRISRNGPPSLVTARYTSSCRRAIARASSGVEYLVQKSPLKCERAGSTKMVAKMTATRPAIHSGSPSVARPTCSRSEGLAASSARVSCADRR